MPLSESLPRPAPSFNNTNFHNRASETTTPSVSLSPLECRGVALCCFVLARCLELGLAVGKNVSKAQEYYLKVCFPFYVTQCKHSLSAIKSRDFDKAMTSELHTLLVYGRM